MLGEHKPDRFLSMLAPEVREYVVKEIAALDHPAQAGHEAAPVRHQGVRAR